MSVCPLLCDFVYVSISLYVCLSSLDTISRWSHESLSCQEGCRWQSVSPTSLPCQVCMSCLLLANLCLPSAHVKGKIKSSSKTKGSVEIEKTAINCIRKYSRKKQARADNILLLGDISTQNWPWLRRFQTEIIHTILAFIKNCFE